MIVISGQHGRHGRSAELILHGLLLVGLLAFVFPGTFLRGEIISPANMLYLLPPWNHHLPEGWHNDNTHLMSDVLSAFRPYYVLAKSAIEHHEWPLWNRYEMWGIPLLANCQSAVFYPPRLLHALLDVDWATTFYILLKLWLCGMTAYICGRGLRLSVGASRFFSIAWMLSSYNVIWCNWSLPDVSAWMPIAFLGCELIIEGRYRRGFFALTTGATLMLLAGHPETTFAFSAGLGAYFFLRLLWQWRRGGIEAPRSSLWKAAAVAGGAWVMALAVCAAQLLPFLEYLLNSSILNDRGVEGQGHAYQFGALASFWIPKFYGTSRAGNFWGEINANIHSMIYPGIVVWLAMAALLLKPRRSNGMATVLALVAGATALISFDFPAFTVLNHMGILRPYWMVFTVFAFALLGALGFEKWFSRPRKLREILVFGLPIAVMATVTASLWGFSRGLIQMLHFESYLRMQVLIAGVLVVIVLVLMCLSCIQRIGPRGRNAIFGLVAAALAGDLIMSGADWNATLPKEQSFPRTDLTDYLRSLPQPARIGIGEGHIPTGFLTPYLIEDWLAYDGLYPMRAIRFAKKLGRSLWGPIEPARGIGYFLSNPSLRKDSSTDSDDVPAEKLRRMELVAQKDGIEIYRNSEAFPRAFLVGQVRAIPNVDEMLNIMKSAEFNPGVTVLTENPPPGALPMSTSINPGKAEITRYQSTRITIKATANVDCALVLSDAFYPGWKATIDNKPAEIFPAYYAFRGILLPAGEHEVRFTYAPWTFYYGLAISIAAVIIISSLGLLSTAQRK